MGLSISNPGASASPKLLVTKSNTAGQSLSSVSVTSVAGGASAWGQVIASTSADTLIVGVGFYCITSVSGSPLVATIDIGYGGAGSESVLSKAFINNGSGVSSWYPGGWVNLPIPQRIASGQRVAARLTQAVTWGTAPACVIYLATVPYANVEGN